MRGIRWPTSPAPADEMTGLHQFSPSLHLLFYGKLPFFKKKKNELPRIKTYLNSGISNLVSCCWKPLLPAGLPITVLSMTAASESGRPKNNENKAVVEDATFPLFNSEEGLSLHARPNRGGLNLEPAC